MNKVLQIVADGSPGGGTTHVIALLEGMKNKYQFCLITQSNSYLFQEARQSGIPCYGIDFFTNRLDLRISQKIKSYHHEFSPELVHVHGARAGWHFCLSNIDGLLIYTVHGYPFQEKTTYQKQVSKKIEKMIGMRANYMIFVSQHDQLLAQNHGLLKANIRSSVIYNGVRLNDNAAVPSTQLSVGFVGRLVPQKDPLLFLDAVRLLPDDPVTIIGSGILEKVVQKKISQYGLSNVVMLGSLKHHQVLNELHKMKVVVITSLWEGLPYLPLEAMWRSVPVVAVRVGGLSEIIQDEHNGLLVSNRSPGVVASAVKRLDAEPYLRNSIVKYGRDCVRERFSLDGMIQKTQQIYEDVLIGR